MPRILIVDDEPDLLDAVSYNLKQAGLETSTARTAADALAQAQRHAPDLVILDVMLPDQPGTEVLKRLRAAPATRATPILMLTARGDEIDRVVGLELGADDYVTKPFSVRELVLRVRGLLRRAAAPPDEGPALIEVGRIRMDLPRHEVTVDGDKIALTPMEFRLLQTLLARRGRVQTREELLDTVWGITAEIETRTVDTHVKRLREKLGRAGDLIETVRGVGYRAKEGGG
jgi:two-component system phosphate regulon response regulator PhoB